MSTLPFDNFMGSGPNEEFAHSSEDYEWIVDSASERDCEPVSGYYLSRTMAVEQSALFDVRWTYAYWLSIGDNESELRSLPLDAQSFVKEEFLEHALLRHPLGQGKRTSRLRVFEFALVCFCGREFRGHDEFEAKDWRRRSLYDRLDIFVRSLVVLQKWSRKDFDLSLSDHCLLDMIFAVPSDTLTDAHMSQMAIRQPPPPSVYMDDLTSNSAPPDRVPFLTTDGIGSESEPTSSPHTEGVETPGNGFDDDAPVVFDVKDIDISNNDNDNLGTEEEGAPRFTAA